MTIEQLIKQLNIDKVGSYNKDKSYTIELEDSDDFGKLYTILETNNNIEGSDDENLVTLDDSTLVYYYNDDFKLYLNANWNDDTYNLTIEEI